MKTNETRKFPGKQKVINNGIYKKYFKRPLDLFCSSLALLVLSPLLLVIAVLVRVNLGSPILFKQTRPGLNEEIFTLYKFRTMSGEKDKAGNLLPDETRITTFGRFLRSTSLDELPELFNIIKGDMSLVGPRPLLVRYLPYYRDKERLRSTVRPGVTGLAQIKGRNSLSWDERFRFDIEYVGNISFLQDVTIVLKTILLVLRRTNILVGSEHILKDLDEERKNIGNV